MFEDSLVESQSAPISATRQWTTISSIVVQSAAAALIIALPLLHPEQLSLHFEPPHVLLPVPPKPVVHIQPAATSSGSPSLSAENPSTSRTVSLVSLLNSHNDVSNEPPTTLSVHDSMGAGAGLPAALATADHDPAVSVAPTRPAPPLKISSGVSAGMLLSPIRPVYPAIARAAHVEGSVVVEAIISRTGAIESLHVISGPAMLRQAAIDAIQTARYQPYRLNGEPTEVQTSITVNFRLGT